MAPEIAIGGMIAIGMIGFIIGWVVRGEVNRSRIETMILQKAPYSNDVLPPGIWLPMSWVADLPQTVFNELMDWLPAEMKNRIMGKRAGELEHFRHGK